MSWIHFSSKYFTVLKFLDFVSDIMMNPYISLYRRSLTPLNDWVAHHGSDTNSTIGRNVSDVHKILMSFWKSSRILISIPATSIRYFVICHWDHAFFKCSTMLLLTNAGYSTVFRKISMEHLLKNLMTFLTILFLDPLGVRNCLFI